MSDIEKLTRGVLQGDIRSIAKAISLVENNLPEKEEVIRRIFPETGGAVVIGVTGPPGSGKSTLVDKLVRQKREEGEKAAVIAVDPSSPFSRGAILGDRIRMQSHAADPGVYIRSMASRGHLGGISNATFDAVKILDAAGFRYILIETIGVGQTEVEIVNLSDLILLVLIPGMGDEIQALKAGVMEIGDLYVINKKDLDGADRLRTEVEYALNLSDGGPTKHDIAAGGGGSGAGAARGNGGREGTSARGERPDKSIHMVSARDDDGTEALSRAIGNRIAEMERSGSLAARRLENTKRELKLLMTEKIKTVMDERFGVSDLLDGWAQEVNNRHTDPYSLINKHITAKIGV